MTRYIDFAGATSAQIRQAAELLVEGFRGMSPAWRDLDSAAAEVEEARADGRIARLALDDEGGLLGWIGGIPMYDGHVWEVHPLVVRPDRQREGVGRALVVELEAVVAERGGVTLYLGTDDETDRTTLGGADLYPNVLGKLARIEDLRGHPFPFWERVGFEVVGVIPDANGFGRPDIMMAKRVGRRGG